MNNIIFIALIILSVVACKSKQTLEYDEFIEFVNNEKNGLKKSEVGNGVLIEVIYRPTDIIAYQQLQIDSDQRSIDSIKNHFSNYFYFLLNLSKESKEALHTQPNTFNEYSSLLSTLSFNMREYVYLTSSSNDTIQVADFYLDRTYGYSKATSLLFVFSKEKIKDSNYIQFNLNEFGLGLGNKRFRFDIEDFNTAPNLEFKKNNL
ncbi:MAG: hypothetical protein O9302_09405 [Cyclobacteriaceae bacterium]|jgi:hypothetical protein|nr:hypothetical protein [Cytophagales bacterium]MCZ8328261.1 hypothetical protein [Cyclobacteriaceae bacterium]